MAGFSFSSQSSTSSTLSFGSAPSVGSSLFSSSNPSASSPFSNSSSNPSSSSSTSSPFSFSFNTSQSSTSSPSSFGFASSYGSSLFSSSNPSASSPFSTSSLDPSCFSSISSAFSFSSNTSFSSSSPFSSATSPSSAPFGFGSALSTAASTPTPYSFGIGATSSLFATPSSASGSTSSIGTSLFSATSSSALSTSPLFGSSTFNTTSATTPLIGTSFSAPNSGSPLFGTGLSAPISSGSSVFLSFVASSSAATTKSSLASSTSPLLVAPTSTSVAATTSITSTPAVQTSSSLVVSSGSGTTSNVSTTVSTTPRLPSEITVQTVEEIIKEWNAELQERIGKFRKQASAIAEWDKRFLQNLDVLLRLEIEVAKVVETQASLERRLELTETQQQEAAKALQSIEEEAECIYKDERGLLLDDEAAATRDAMYEQAELIEREMEQMAEQIKSVIQTLNAKQVIKAPEARPEMVLPSTSLSAPQAKDLGRVSLRDQLFSLCKAQRRVGIDLPQVITSSLGPVEVPESSSPSFFEVAPQPIIREEEGPSIRKETLRPDKGKGSVIEEATSQGLDEDEEEVEEDREEPFSRAEDVQEILRSACEHLLGSPGFMERATSLYPSKVVKHSSTVIFEEAAAILAQCNYVSYRVQQLKRWEKRLAKEAVEVGVQSAMIDEQIRLAREKAKLVEKRAQAAEERATSAVKATVKAEQKAHLAKERALQAEATTQTLQAENALLRASLTHAEIQQDVLRDRVVQLEEFEQMTWQEGFDACQFCVNLTTSGVDWEETQRRGLAELAKLGRSQSPPP